MAKILDLRYVEDAGKKPVIHIVFEPSDVHTQMDIDTVKVRIEALLRGQWGVKETSKAAMTPRSRPSLK